VVDVSKGSTPGGPGVNLTKGQAISLQKKDGGTLTAVRMGLGWQAALLAPTDPVLTSSIVLMSVFSFGRASRAR